jgi:predicted MFS family arabinose efflux permease
VFSRLRPLAKLARNPSLRRCGTGFALFSAAEYGEWIAVLVYAYSKGGAGASGLLAFAMLLPCIVLSPLTATFADRAQPGRVLVAGYLAQGVAMGLLAAALLADPAPIVVYAFAVLAAPTFNLTRPTLNVLMPLAVRSPDELTAGNAAMGWIENAGVVVGPLTTSLLVALWGAGSALALFAGLMLLAAILSLPLTRSLPPADASSAGSPLADAVEVFRLLRRERGTASLVGVLTSQSLFFGAMDVLFVVLAIDELGMGDSGVGVLSAVFGVGGLLALVVTLGLVGRRRLAPALIASAAVMGSIALIAVWPTIALALVLLAVANIGRSLFDVTGRTLLQRTGSPHLLGRIFGVLESINSLGLALGSVLVSLLVALGGTTAAIVGVGAIMPLITLVLLPAILGADARATVPIIRIGLLRSMPLFQPLPAPELEGVARAMEPLAVGAGDVIIREGDPGDLYYAIADGEVTVSTASGFTRELTRGDGFGEIALLNDTPRTATVTAATDVSLYTLTSDDFLTAVTGAPDLHRRAQSLVADRLAQLDVAPAADLPR